MMLAWAHFAYEVVWVFSQACKRKIGTLIVWLQVMQSDLAPRSLQKYADWPVLLNSLAVNPIRTCRIQLLIRMRVAANDWMSWWCSSTYYGVLWYKDVHHEITSLIKVKCSLQPKSKQKQKTRTTLLWVESQTKTTALSGKSKLYTKLLGKR